MRLVSWNVNGIRAALKKDFVTPLDILKPDILCLQESKAQEEQVDLSDLGYHVYWNSAVKKGYSGTIILSKEKPISVTNDIGVEEHDQEGRVICAEYDKFYLINVYTPNSKRDLARLDNRMEWEDEFLKYLNNLNKIKPVIICGDLNVAHQEIDLKNPKTNKRNAGFTIEERDKLTAFLDAGYIDSFRYLYPNKVDAYSWWSYMAGARDRNVGWRIDYFILSNKLKTNLVEASIHSDIYGSDHCPVSIDINV